MSHRLLSWTFLLTLSTPALAHNRAQTFQLPNCGGQAIVYRNDRQTVVKLEDVDECSNVTIDGQRQKMQIQYNERYSYVYSWQPTVYRDTLTLRVHSNSNRTEDYVRLTADGDDLQRPPRWQRPTRWDPRPAPVVTTYDDGFVYLDESRNSALLPECGGRMRIDLEYQRLVVRVEGPETCDRVRLTVFNQQPLIMESVRRLDHRGQVWTFALPERALRPGRNSLTLAVQNSRRDRADQVRYYFAEPRWFFASGGR